jgi:hypothetical protein
LPKTPKAKPKGKHRAAKYTLYFVFTLVVMLTVLNGGLFVLGLSSIAFPTAQATGNNIGMTLSVPNESFVPINGRVVTSVYDATTGELLGSGDNSFYLAARSTGPVTLSIPMQSTNASGHPIRVTMDYYVGAYGFTLPWPIRGADVTLPPYQG